MTTGVTAPGRIEPYFFLSFATTTERDDALVDKFFHDLCAEIRTSTGLRQDHADAVGFLSRVTLRLGADWWAELRTSLSRAAVFVALCAPTYFRSAACGKEWRAFTDRQDAYRAATGEIAPCLLPITWMPASMPAAQSHIQHADRRLAPELHRTGLRKFMLLDRYRDDYIEFVGALAQHIVDTATRYRLPPGEVAERFDRQPQAFPDAPPAPATRPVPAPPPDPVEPPDLRDDRFPRLHSP